MKAAINELFLTPISPELENHILNELGFREDDKKIIHSLMHHYGDSTFHYAKTNIPRERFEYRLKFVIMPTIFAELIRLAKVGFYFESCEKERQNTVKTE